MSRVCTVTGKKSIVGNKVSHSQVKTKRQFRPNLVNSSFWSDILNRNIKIKVSTSAIRTVEKHGGFDTWITNAKPSSLSSDILKIKKTISKRLLKK